MSKKLFSFRKALQAEFLSAHRLTQRIKRAIKHLLSSSRRRRLRRSCPLEMAAADAFNDLYCVHLPLSATANENIRSRPRQKCCFILVLAKQQVQKSRFPRPFLPVKPMLPVGIYLKADIFKNAVVAAVIRKR
jgi:hypothetical protein